MLEQTRLTGEVDISAEGSRLIISPAARRPRTGCADAFQAMAQIGDDTLLDGPEHVSTRWEEVEWDWQ